MSRSLPPYPDDLAGFAGILRSYLGLSQRKLAARFPLDHSTIARYESEGINPPLGYLACLVRLVLQKHQDTNKQQPGPGQQFLLQQINKAIAHNYLDEPPLQSWTDLESVADVYLARLQDRHDPTRQAKPHPLPAPGSLAVAPAEIPPLPHFYIKRPALQALLLDKLKGDHLHTLVLWGAGGAGKSTLAAWLAKTTQAEFPGGQIWLELSEMLTPEELIAEAQAQLARRFEEVLSGASLAERAAQLRTLLQDKRCLVILDNVWTTSGLNHLQVINDQSALLVTTRYRKVADVLEAPFVHVDRMTTPEGLALLARWAEKPITNSDLVERVGGLPLALKLSGVQLREGSTADELLSYFQQYPLALDQLDLDDPQNERESLHPCFEQSFSRLQPIDRPYFARLGCFAGRFELAAAAQVWGLTFNSARQLLRRLENQALVERDAAAFHLHPLLRDYARYKLLTTSNDSQAVYRRHAAYYLRHHLDHPQVLDDVTAEAPPLAENWADVVAGVTWAAERLPQWAAIAALLAHTERPALLEAIGSPLVAAVETYLTGVNDLAEAAFLRDLLGDLFLLSHLMEEALSQFDQAAGLWQQQGQPLFSSRARLRQAGVYLLQQNEPAALAALHQAQSAFAGSLPLLPERLEPARWLFYWFDIIYSGLVKGEAAGPLAEAVTTFVELAQKTNQPLLEARAWHVYRLFHTARHAEADPQKARQGAARAAWLWRRYHQRDKALAEIMWTQEQTKHRRSHRLASQFARRLSQATPALSQEEIESITNEKVRWWLEANEAERVGWLVKELPPPGSGDWSPLAGILNIGTTGAQVRRTARGLPRPEGHPISAPLWKVLAGQRSLPLAGEAAADLVKRYRTILENELSL